MESGGVAGNVLLVDDSTDFQALLAALASKCGCELSCAESLQAARRMVKTVAFDLVLLDLALPDGNGMDLVETMDLPDSGRIIVVTGTPSLETAMRAVRGPVVDYLVKPVAVDTLRELLQQACRHALQRPLHRPGAGAGFGMVGESPAMQDLFRKLAAVAPTDVNVLLHGESGTGKELAARALHQLSGRRGPFIALNCGAVSPDLLGSQLFGHERGAFTGAIQAHAGVFERAEGGTLFLDEVTEMPLAMQVYLLRAIESKRITRVGGSREIPFDVRLIAATNRDPERAVADQVMRKDLYYRLADFPIRLPPLRERGQDMVLIAQEFLDRLNARYGSVKRFGEEALARLVASSWPGNVRELRSAVQRAYILSQSSESLTFAETAEVAADEEDDGSVSFRIGTSIEQMEKKMLLKTLAYYGNNKRKAADALGITTKTIYNKLAHYRAAPQQDDPDLQQLAKIEN